MWKRPMLSAVLILRVPDSRSGSKSTIGVGLPSRPTGVLLFLVDCVARSCVAQVDCVAQSSWRGLGGCAFLSFVAC